MYKQAFLSLFLLASFLLIDSRVSAQSEDNTKFTETAKGITFDMLKIEGGTFQMGSNSIFEHEHPLHAVTIPSFYMASTEVTQQLWEAVTGDNPSFDKDCVTCPVINVSWIDAQDFLVKLNKLTGKNYRLPTEAEWEYAAGNGAKHTKYSWGNAEPLDKKGGNVADMTLKESMPKMNIFKNYRDGFVFACPVASFDSNDFGLYDMTGNVLEWCSDWYSSDYYKTSPKDNPQGPETGTKRTLRGAGWSDYSDVCTIPYRSAQLPEFTASYIGLRIVLSL